MKLLVKITIKQKIKNRRKIERIWTKEYNRFLREHPDIIDYMVNEVVNRALNQ